MARRALIGAAASSALLPLIAEAAGGGAPEGMRTSESFGSLQDISPETTGTLGAGTISSRSRPATGIVMLEEPQAIGDVNGPFIEAEVILDGGVAANVGFQAEKGYGIARGMYNDVEAKAKGGGKTGSVMINVFALPEGKNLGDIKDEFITSKVFSSSSRFGAYGAPNVRKKARDKSGLLDVSFTILSPSGRESPNRALIAAVQPEQSTDAVVIVASSSNKNFDDEEKAFRKMIASLKIRKIRPTKLARTQKNDYRFEDRGGVKNKNKEGEVSEVS
jgi:hypothetical protein